MASKLRFRPKIVKEKKFMFNIEKDIHLLNEAIKSNPWHLGKDQWMEVSKNLKEKFDYDIKPRTAKDRIDNLLIQLERDEFTTKAGTEEQKTERSTLLRDIKNLKELVCEDEETGAQMNFISVKPSIRSNQVATTLRRDEMLRSYIDCAPIPCSTRKKRNKVAEEEDDLIVLKLNHDMVMKERQMVLEEKNSALEEKRLELEFAKERRLEEENKRRDEFMLQVMNIMAQFAPKRETQE